MACVSRTGLRMRCREGVCGNNAVQFHLVAAVVIAQRKGQMAALIISRQLRDSSIVRRWCGQFTEGRSNVRDGDRSGRSSVVTSELM